MSSRSSSIPGAFVAPLLALIASPGLAYAGGPGAAVAGSDNDAFARALAGGTAGATVGSCCKSSERRSQRSVPLRQRQNIQDVLRRSASATAHVNGETRV